MSSKPQDLTYTVPKFSKAAVIAGAIDVLREDNARLRAENARLRTLLDGCLDSQECNGYIGCELVEEISAALKDSA